MVVAAAAATFTSSTVLSVVFSTVPPCKTSAATELGGVAEGKHAPSPGGGGGDFLRMKETARKPSALLAKSVPRVLAAASSTAGPSTDRMASNVEGDGGGGDVAAGNQVKTSRCDDDDATNREMVAGGAVYRQVFRIRSYEVGADGKVSVPTLMNHLQDTGLNHVRCMGLMGDGFGATPEMCKRALIWVVTKMCFQIHAYASWGTSVNVDTWINSTKSKNRIRREWQVCDQETGQTLLRATGIWVVMNKHTRRLCKIPEQVREELQPYFRDRVIALSIDGIGKFDMLDQQSVTYARKGLSPSWNDLDVNQHVNHVKYVSWIFENIPDWILKNYEAISIILEYHKECNIGSMLESFTIVSTPNASHNLSIECQHTLQLESGSSIIRGQTIWRPK